MQLPPCTFTRTSGAPAVPRSESHTPSALAGAGAVTAVGTLFGGLLLCMAVGFGGAAAALDDLLGREAAGAGALLPFGFAIVRERGATALASEEVCGFVQVHVFLCERPTNNSIWETRAQHEINRSTPPLRTTLERT